MPRYEFVCPGTGETHTFEAQLPIHECSGADCPIHGIRSTKKKISAPAVVTGSNPRVSMFDREGHAITTPPAVQEVIEKAETVLKKIDGLQRRIGGNS